MKFDDKHCRTVEQCRSIIIYYYYFFASNVLAVWMNESIAMDFIIFAMAAINLKIFIFILMHCNYSIILSIDWIGPRSMLARECGSMRISHRKFNSNEIDYSPRDSNSMLLWLNQNEKAHALLPLFSLSRALNIQTTKIMLCIQFSFLFTLPHCTMQHCPSCATDLFYYKTLGSLLVWCPKAFKAKTKRNEM